MFVTRFIFLLSFLETARAQCSMCTADDAVLTNPDKIIPFLGLSGQENPTCQQVFDFAPELATGDQICDLIQAQSSFCGCPESSGPIDVCGLCPDGPASNSATPDLITPFGDTCGYLEEYLSYLTAEECATDRVALIQRNNWLCQCPNAETICSMCPDGTVVMENEDLVVPFFNTPSNDNPTCSEVRNFASLQNPDDDQFDCSLVQEQAGFCGCPNIVPTNACTFCADGSAPANSNLETPTTDTCEDLNSYFSYLTTEGCKGDVASSISAVGYVCGCAGAVPNCQLCPDKEPVTNPNQDSTSQGLTCGQLETIVSTLTPGICTSRSDLIAPGTKACCDTSGVVSTTTFAALLLAAIAAIVPFL